jgi:hypothetical protein
VRRLILLFVLGLAGCGGDAVVFAPTPAPPDLSPLVYTHPAGVFSLVAPRTWSVYEINTTVLAATAFSRPGTAEPALIVSVANLGDPPEPQAFAALLERYQTQARPDVERYAEQSRQVMGDGSWRMTGIRRLPGGLTQAVNTFIQQVESRLVVIEVALPDDQAQQAELQRVINTVRIDSNAQLEVTDLSAFSAAKPASLALLHLFAWTAPQGVFFITGEVANYGSIPAFNVPVRARLTSTDGSALAEAVDVVMGYGIPAGGFAPFSLRFGQGQPGSAHDFQIFLGGSAELPSAALFPADQLVTEDESSFDDLGRLIIRGSVENVGSLPARAPRAVATIFDAAQNVIAAAFVELPDAAIPPGGRSDYTIAIPEFGGEPVNYIVQVQALE